MPHVSSERAEGARIAVVPPVRGGSCAAPRSGRARSKHRRRPQLCAKPPHRPLPAQRASVPSLPATSASRWCLAGSPRPGWPDALAGGGTSAHLADVRSTREWSSSQAERSGRCTEQSQRVAPMRSSFWTPTDSPTGSRRHTAQTNPAAPFWPSDPSAARVLAAPTLVNDAGCLATMKRLTRDQHGREMCSYPHRWPTRCSFPSTNNCFPLVMDYHLN